MPASAFSSLTYEEFFQCCSCDTFARRLAEKLAQSQGGHDPVALARRIWWHEVPVTGWLEAFAAHPRIGDVEGLRKKFGGFADLSRSEQAAAGAASEAVLEELADWNRRYEERFGHIFIICASGRPAADILHSLKARYTNAPHAELALAAAEQMKITELRLHTLLHPTSTSAESSSTAGSTAAAATSSSTQETRSAGVAAAERRAGQMLAHLAPVEPSRPHMQWRREGSGAAQLLAAPTAAPPGLRAPITTHMLDTSLGRPASGVPIALHQLAPGSNDIWVPLAQGVTNSDGRIPDLMPPSDAVEAGMYRMSFGTATYMAACQAEVPHVRAFYPRVQVHFQIDASQVKQHFHVPLTWNPYGYNTYRGS